MAQDDDYQGVWSPVREIDDHLIDAGLDDLEKQFSRLERSDVQSVNFAKYKALGEPETVNVTQLETEVNNGIRNLGRITVRVANLVPNRFMSVDIPAYRQSMRVHASGVLGALKECSPSWPASVPAFVSALEDYLNYAVEAAFRAQLELPHHFNVNNHAATVGLRARAFLQKFDTDSREALKRSLGRLTLAVDQSQEVPDVLQALRPTEAAPAPAPAAKVPLGNLKVAELEHTGRAPAHLDRCSICGTSLPEFASYYREDGQAYCGWSCRQKAIDRQEQANRERAALDAKYRAIPAYRLTYTPEKMDAALQKNPNYLYETAKPKQAGPRQTKDASPQQGRQTQSSAGTGVAGGPRTNQQYQPTPSRAVSPRSVTTTSPPASPTRAFSPPGRPLSPNELEESFRRKLDQAYSQLTEARQSIVNFGTCPTCHQLVMPRAPFPCIGQVAKQGGKVKTWKVRWLVLHNGHLTYFDAKADIGGRPPLGIIHLGPASSCTAQPVPAPDKWKNKAAWMFHTPARPYIFICETEAERDEWIREVRLQQPVE